MTDPKLLTFIATAVVVLGYSYGPWLWSMVRAKWPTISTSTPEVSAADAFAAAELLVRYYDKRQCLEGSRAAKAAASHLLDCPGGAA